MAREGNDMAAQFFVWANMAMDAIEIAVLGAVLFLLFYVRRDLSAMLRVLRRLDRKAPDMNIRAFVDRTSEDRTGITAIGRGQ